MVVQRRLSLAVVSALALVLAAAAPMGAATKEVKPSPLRSANLVRVKDIATNGVIKPGVVAVGYHEAANPAQLYVAWSVNGGSDYRKANGNLRRYRIVGEPSLGMSVAVCAGRVWVATAWRHPSDRAGDSDVILTSRTIAGGAAQAFMTKRTGNHRVRDVSVTCVSGKLLAVGWLQKDRTKTSAKLMLRSVEPLGTTPSYKRTLDLGKAEFQGGMALASTPAQAAVAFVRGGDLRLHRLAIKGGKAGLSNQKTIVWNDVKHPVMATKGDRLVVAYSDAGRVKAKTSKDLGTSYSKPHVLAKPGGTKNPSRPYSVDVVGNRIVTTAGIYSAAAGRVTPKRISSSDFGGSWKTASFGNVGARVAALLKVKGQGPLLMEAWHNNAPKGYSDTLRARYELK